MKKIISIFLGLVLMITPVSEVFAMDQNLFTIYRRSENEVLVFERNNGLSYVKSDYDSEGNFYSRIEDKDHNLEQVISKDEEWNINIFDSEGNTIHSILAEEIGLDDQRLTPYATQFCSVLGQKTASISKNISFQSMITTAGTFIGFASLVGVLGTAVGTVVTLSAKVSSAVSGIISIALNEGARLARGGIRFSGPKVCPSRRGGSNPYKIYVFEPTSGVRY